MIDLVGVELEGAWQKTPDAMHGDGSVDDFPSEIHDIARLGEVSSPPMKRGDVGKYIRDFYPDFVNKTCGFHVHVSFTNIGDYNTLMSQRFFDFCYERLGAWGKKTNVKYEQFWKRLKGENRQYCPKKYNAEKQIMDTERSSCRYSGINYCWELHKTIEFRVLPMFLHKRVTVSAAKELFKIVDKYLQKNRSGGGIIVSEEIEIESLGIRL